MDDRIPVCIFAKPIVAGAVKTRIASVLGGEAAAQLAGALFDDVLHVVRACAWARPVVATTDVAAFTLPEGVELWAQGDGDLGDRVERVMRRAVAEAGMAFVVGADTAGLTLDDLDAARASLADLPAVIGPSDDGGFWLLGLSSVPEGLLKGLPWSAQRTRAATVQRLRARVGEVAFAADRFDVDVVDDMTRLISAGASGQIARGRADVVARVLLGRSTPPELAEKS